MPQCDKSNVSLLGDGFHKPKRNNQVQASKHRSEKDLILARVGFFDVMGDDMTVCPKHRAALGTWWRPSLKCYHPLHGIKRRKPERGASLQMCKEIIEKWRVLVPIGAGQKNTKDARTEKGSLFVKNGELKNKDCK